MPNNLYLLVRAMFFSIFSLSINTITGMDNNDNSLIYNYGNVYFYEPSRKEKCDLIKSIPKDFVKVAVSPDLFLNSAVCGACIEGEITFNNDEIIKFNGIVNNVFKGFYYGDIAINAKNTHGDAIWPVKWNYVKCPTPTIDMPKSTDKPDCNSTKPPIFSSKEPAGSTCKNAIMHLNGKVCCPKSCKKCGNLGCQNRPGGEENCCYTGILKLHNVSCDTHPAPCVINKKKK